MRKIILGWLIAFSSHSIAYSDSGTAYPTAKLIGFTQLRSVDNEFLIKRARLGVKGNVTEKISYNLAVGFVEPPDSQPHLVNAFIDIDHFSSMKIRAGQFFVPFGLEGPQSIFKNPAIERSSTIRNLNPFRLFRDVGIRVSNNSESFDYAAAIVNGTGANIKENNNSKDILGRVGFKPTPGLTIGGSAHYGKFLTGSTNLNRDRYGVDFEYLKNGWRYRGEYITRRDARVGTGDLNAHGWYLLAGYRLTKTLENIVRYEQYKPDTGTRNNLLTITTLGCNYIFKNHNRLSLNYEIRNDEADATVGNLLTMQLQVVL